MAMARNRVKYWADSNGWTEEQLYAHAVLAKQSISKSTVHRFYTEPTYLGNRASLEALARVFNVRYTDMVEDVDVPEQPNES